MQRSSASERLRIRSDRRWHQLATASASEFTERLAATRHLQLSDRDRQRIGRRLREVIDSAMAVQPERSAAAALTAARLRGAAGPLTLPEIAWARVREHARHTAAIGAVTTLPAMIPGLGTAMAALGLVADWQHVAEEQRDLVLEVAALFEVPLLEPTAEVRFAFVAGAAAAFGERVGEPDIIRVLAEHVARRCVARVVPGAGVVVASGLNYVATAAIGRAAIQRYARRAGVRVEPLIQPRSHPELTRLEQAIIAAIRTAISGDDVAMPLFGVDQRAALAELSVAERETLFDLAVVCSASQGGLSAEEQRVLAHIADALGFPIERLLSTISDAQHDVAVFGARFRTLLDSPRDTPASVTRTIWRRTRMLARTGRLPDGARP
jgi:hypothetical protein